MATAIPDFGLLCELTADDKRYDELEAVLIAGSHLPGPPANLSLAAAFADCIEAAGLSEPQWLLLTRWLAIAEDKAPSGHPQEFVPFCSVQAQVLDRWARSGDPGLVWIVRENLKKNPLSRPFAAEVARVAQAMD